MNGSVSRLLASDLGDLRKQLMRNLVGRGIWIFYNEFRVFLSTTLLTIKGRKVMLCRVGIILKSLV